MKNLLYLLFIGILFSCGGTGENDEVNTEEPDANEEPKEYIVSLGFSDEILDIEEFPLGRSINNDLYGIQVYSKTPSTDYHPYAYGLFDDKNKMLITLQDGYLYKFVATMICDGKNKLSGKNNFYGSPFQQELKNSFVYNNNYEMGINRGTTELPIDGTLLVFDIPNTDRYYGYITDYTPSDNTSVVIAMKRVVFGAKFIAKNLNEGKLKIVIDGAPTLFIENSNDVKNDIYTFKYVSTCFEASIANNVYSEKIPVSVWWQKDNGNDILLINNKSIEFKLRKTTSITINVQDSSNDSNVQLMPDVEEIIPRDDITI